MNTLHILLITTFFLSLNTSYGTKDAAEKDEHGLILYLYKDKKYHFPQYFNGLKSHENQFFCPATTLQFQDIDSNCLVRMEKDKFQCENAIEPLLITSPLEIPCGMDGESVYYDFVYRLCINDKNGVYELKNYNKEDAIIKADQLIYRVCYNMEKKKTIFTYHSIIKPPLLNNEHLINERSVVYKFKTESYLLKENNFSQQKAAYESSHHDLKPLTLISSEDMAFALWKKPVHHYVNIQPAWENIIKIWKTINNHLRENIINEDYKTFQINGSMGELELDGKKVFLNEEHGITVPKYFWKLLYTPKGDQLITIVIHNVPDEKYTLDRLCGESEHHKINYIEEKWQKLAYSCEPKVIADLFHLPQQLNLLEDKNNFLPLYQKNYYFCHDELNIIKSLTQNETDEKYHNCLVLNKNTNHNCRKPLDTVSAESKNDVGFCASQNEIYYDETFRFCFINEKSKEITINENMVLYSYCLNTQSQTTTFTYHKLMTSEFTIMDSFLQEIPTANFQLKKYKNQRKIDNFDSVPDRYEKKQKYKHELGIISQLTLVSPDDFPFTVWKKPMFLPQNIKLAWTNVTKMWEYINDRIQKQAGYEEKEYIQINGVQNDLLINGKLIEIENETLHLPKIFWKVVYNADMNESLAVILHNVPHSQYIYKKDKLCDSSTCDIKKWDPQYNDRNLNLFGYCCNSDVITKRYNLPQTENYMKIEGFNPY